jgi:hypothetical protein
MEAARKGENILEIFVEGSLAWEKDPSAEGARELLRLLGQHRPFFEEIATANEVRFFNFDDAYLGAQKALSAWLNEDNTLQLDVARRCLSELMRFTTLS